MSSSREALAKACTAYLKSCGRPHAEENSEYCGRYVLDGPSGPVALMLEHSAKVPINLWTPKGMAKASWFDEKRKKDSPAALLWTKRNKNGDLLYGRHNGLKSMPELVNADLDKFQIEMLDELKRLIEEIAR